MKEIIRQNMIRKNATQYRPEQILTFDILRLYSKASQITLEYELPPHRCYGKDNTNDLGIHPIFDIWFAYKSGRYALELDGPVHDEKKQINKDELRDIWLATRANPIFSIRMNHRFYPAVWKGQYHKAVQEIAGMLLQVGIPTTLTASPKTLKI